MEYKLKEGTLHSRRGNYQVVTPQHNPLVWTPLVLDLTFPRHMDVADEVRFAQEGRLSAHKYWQDEPPQWIDEYQQFYNKLFSLDWLHEDSDRHNIVANPQCCLTLVQYHNHRLIAYSRSTDMRNGYYSDKLILDYLAHTINTRTAYLVTSIEWYMAVPHVYKKRGVARLLERTK